MTMTIAAFFVLGYGGLEADHVTANIAPFEGEHFTFAPAGVVGKAQYVLQVGRRKLTIASISCCSKKPWRGIVLLRVFFYARDLL